MARQPIDKRLAVFLKAQTRPDEKDPNTAALSGVLTPDTPRRYKLRHVLMLNPQKTLEREAMLKRIHELDAEIAQRERNSAGR